jgi:hypothetical protein
MGSKGLIFLEIDRVEDAIKSSTSLKKAYSSEGEGPSLL